MIEKLISLSLRNRFFVGPKTFTVPLNAVIRDSQGAHVHVQTAAHTYQPRRVRTGTTPLAAHNH